MGFVSLGCPKALVDSERIITELKLRGYAIAPGYRNADLVVVNTCGFIDAAIDESLPPSARRCDQNGRVLVTGCLGAHPERILERHPKVLAITGPHATRECSRPSTRTCRSRMIRTSTWCRRRASASRRATTRI